MDRSLRQLGQLLVVMGALLGAVLGVALALTVEHADTSGAVVESGRDRVAVLADSPPSSRPPVSRGGGSEDPTGGNGASGSQRAEATDQADQGDEKADKPGKDKDDKDKDKDKPGNGKDKSKGNGKSK